MLDVLKIVRIAHNQVNESTHSAYVEPSTISLNVNRSPGSH